MRNIRWSSHFSSQNIKLRVHLLVQIIHPQPSSMSHFIILILQLTSLFTLIILQSDRVISRTWVIFLPSLQLGLSILKHLLLSRVFCLHSSPSIQISVNLHFSSLVEDFLASLVVHLSPTTIFRGKISIKSFSFWQIIVTGLFRTVNSLKFLVLVEPAYSLFESHFLDGFSVPHALSFGSGSRFYVMKRCGGD